jgi:hypothetical protein
MARWRTFCGSRFGVTIPVLSDGRQLDWRVGVAMAVALDTLQRR